MVVEAPPPVRINKNFYSSERVVACRTGTGDRLAWRRREAGAQASVHAERLVLV